MDTLSRRTVLQSAAGIAASLAVVPLLSASAFGADAATGAKKHKLLFLTGQNNHDWKRTSAFITKTLEDTGLFDVELWFGPGKDTPADKVEIPRFADYAAVVWDYNPRWNWGSDKFADNYQWPEALRKAWVDYVLGGGKAFLVHASNNPFPGWKEYEDMVGLLWRGPGCGCRACWDKDQKWEVEPVGVGKGAGHGRVHSFPIQHRDPEHPVLKGLPEKWLHAGDELYHNQRGPAPASMKILASAWSDPSTGGTGKHEPMLWQIPYGKGLVMTWLPGHLWGGQGDTSAHRCVGFRAIITRSLEWLASGQVTQAVPADFPAADKVSVLPA